MRKILISSDISEKEANQLLDWLVKHNPKANYIKTYHPCVRREFCWRVYKVVNNA